MPTNSKPSVSLKPAPNPKAKSLPIKPAAVPVRMMDPLDAEARRTQQAIQRGMDMLNAPRPQPMDMRNTLSARGGAGGGGMGSGGSMVEPQPVDVARPLGGFRTNADNSRTYIPRQQPAQVGTPRMGDVGTVFSQAATNDYDRQVSQTMADKIRQAATPAEVYQAQRYADRLAAYNLPGRFGEEAMAAVDHYPGASGPQGYRPISQTYQTGLRQAQDAGLNMSSNRVQSAVLGQMSVLGGRAPATAAGRQAVQQAGNLDTAQIGPMVQEDIRFAPAYERARRRELEQKAQADQRLLDRQMATWGLRGQTAVQVQDLKNQGGLATQGMKNQSASEVQNLRNQGGIERTKVRNDGTLAVQKERNQGNVQVQGMRGKTAESVQGMRGKTAESVQGMRNQGNANVQNIRNQGNVDATELKNQGRIDAIRTKNAREKPGAPNPGRLGANPLESIVQRYFGQRPAVPSPGATGGPVGSVSAGVDDPQFAAIPAGDRQALDGVPPEMREAKAQELEAQGHPIAAAYLRSR